MQFLIANKLEQEGRNERDLYIRQEFYRLRGTDHGIDKTFVERQLDSQFNDLMSAVKGRRSKSKQLKDSHNYFISKANAE